MKYLVLEYDKNNNAHRCQNEDGHKFFIDLMVSSDLQVDDDKYDQYIKNLTGKTVEVEMITHYVAIAHGIKVL